MKKLSEIINSLPSNVELDLWKVNLIAAKLAMNNEYPAENKETIIQLISAFANHSREFAKNSALALAQAQPELSAENFFSYDKTKAVVKVKLNPKNENEIEIVLGIRDLDSGNTYFPPQNTLNLHLSAHSIKPQDSSKTEMVKTEVSNLLTMAAAYCYSVEFYKGFESYKRRKVLYLSDIREAVNKAIELEHPADTEEGAIETVKWFKTNEKEIVDFINNSHSHFELSFELYIKDLN